MDETEGIAEQAADVLALGGWTVAGAGIGLVVALILLVVLGLSGRRSELMARLYRRMRGPLPVVGVILGAWVAFGFSEPDDTVGWVSAVRHILLLTLIGSLGWVGVALANLVQDAALIRIEKDPRDSRRLQTQSQVLRRVLQSIVVIVTVIAALLTFPAARAPIASLLASAGVISIVLGLAAQSSLGNAFAGLQLAFTDAIRVGDTVTITVSNKSESGVVEELTLTYVVIRLWDERRVLLPSTEFTTKPFENWSRRDTEQLGTILLPLDWTVPMAQLRQQVEKIVTASDLWDRRTWNVQMVSSAPGLLTPTIRIVVSAQNPGDLHDLKCQVREEVVAWIVSEIPSALPRSRSQTMEVEQVKQNLDKSKVAELAQELAGISGQETGEKGVPDYDPIHEARVRAARQKTKAARRRSLLSGRPANHPTPQPVATDPDATSVLTEQGSRLFSGSPAALERRRIYDGPGKDVLDERERTATMQALDAKGQLKKDK